MAGTRSGGLKAARTNERLYPGFYANIGRAGGKKQRGGGFASKTVGKDGLTGPERAALAGQKGGSMGSKAQKESRNKARILAWRRNEN